MADFVVDGFESLYIPLLQLFPAIDLYPSTTLYPGATVYGEVSVVYEPQTITVYNVDEATGEVFITTDGDSNLIVTEVVDGNITECADGEAGIITEVHTGELPYYTGPTEVTPSTEPTVLPTNNHTMGSNITINPIPSNYGLITWNGVTLTVS